MTWKPVYGLLILGLTVVNYVFGLAIARAEKQRKTLLVAAVAANLITLGIFKYAYFSWDMLRSLVAPLGGQWTPLPFQIILPLGISFFVFEFIHYVSDVYKGGQPVRSFVNFALFASFFPTQIAGPIKRYQDFIPQLANDKKFSFALINDGVGLIVFGLFKKVLFADNLSVVVQSAFARPDLLSGVDLWLAVYAFAFQIYFDFSGYTDIARGSAALLGYKVPPNFNLPYLAGSITEFWHRWHMSLSTWLRDYLFIPLGGNRGGNFLTLRNLLITMVLGGLWHGAALHFVAWGAYQGVFLILHKEWKRLSEPLNWLNTVKQNKFYAVVSVLVTFHIVCIGWVLFRADNFASARDIICKLLCFDAFSRASSPIAPWSMSIVNVGDPVIFLILPFVLLLLFAGQILALVNSRRLTPLMIPLPIKCVYLAAMVSTLMVFAPDTSPKFIYFQF
jgi:D-alanyl-lipoteichoic acid acyltransferase DltB (MBOAT superfamily)